MSNNNENLKANQKDNFKPAEKAESPAFQEKCIFVIHEAGKYEATKEFIKLNAFFDGTGWLLQINHKKSVEKICNKYNLMFVEIPIPSNFEKLKNNTETIVFNDKIVEIENKIRILTASLGIKWILVNELSSEDKVEQLSKTNDGLKVVQLLKEHQKFTEKLSWISKFSLGNHEQDIQDKKGTCLSSSDVLKNTKIIDVIKNKMSQFKQTGTVSLSGLSTGYEMLDNIIDGLVEENLILLAGRTGMGKSWAALNLIRNIAIVQKIPTALFSLEMSYLQLMNRLISMQSGISSKKIKNGTLCSEEFNEVIKAIGTIADSALFISEDPANSKLYNLLSNIAHAYKTYGIKFVVIDHIGLIKQNEGSNNNRANEVGEITRAIKMAAKMHKIPILCLAQLNRNADNYEVPKLSQLRESGALEQDSDIVIFVNRCDYYNPQERMGEFEVIIAKNRDGEQNITLQFTYDNIWVLKEVGIKNDEQESTQASKPSTSKKKPDNSNATPSTVKSYLEKLGRA